MATSQHTPPTPEIQGATPNTRIRFNAHPSGHIETLCGGPSGLSYLRTLFAVAGAYTGSIEAPYGTDAEGLARLKEIACQAEDAIGDAIAVIGDLLAAIDPEADTPDLSVVGFTLRGLADLRADVAYVGRNADFQLRQQTARKDVHGQSARGRSAH